VSRFLFLLSQDITTFRKRSLTIGSTATTRASAPCVYVAAAACPLRASIWAGSQFSGAFSRRNEHGKMHD
jgi:hypothetical protein